MSFFKKLLGTTDVSPEEKALLEAKKLEKQRLKEEKKRENEIKYQEEQRQREVQKQQDKILHEKYVGPAGSFSTYKHTIYFFEQNVLRPDERVLHSLKAEYDKTKTREIKGLLIATDQRLVFVSNGLGSGNFVEEFDYKKMNGLAQRKDGFFEKELYIDMGRSRKKFDDILPDQRFMEFADIIMEQINIARNAPKPTRRATSATKAPVDKYTALEKLASLKKMAS